MTQSQTFVARKDQNQMVDKQLLRIREMAQLSSSGITVFDARKNTHIYASRNFYQLYGYGIEEDVPFDNSQFDKRVHPDDLKMLSENGYKAMRFMNSIPAACKKHYKMVSEYRIIACNGSCIQVIEQHQALELDDAGDIWLSLGMIDIAPNQTPGHEVKSQIHNFHTGEIIDLAKSEIPGQARLTTRETEILRMISEGKLSKEIAVSLKISIHTVSTHRQHILEKLGVDNAIEAITVGRRKGLI
jgi:DNA-binding CsgD family transcriptional regulator